MNTVLCPGLEIVEAIECVHSMLQGKIQKGFYEMWLSDNYQLVLCVCIHRAREELKLWGGGVGGQVFLHRNAKKNDTLTCTCCSDGGGCCVLRGRASVLNGLRVLLKVVTPIVSGWESIDFHIKLVNNLCAYQGSVFYTDIDIHPSSNTLYTSTYLLLCATHS